MSFEIRRRDASSFWWNDEPILDVGAALSVLLKDGYSDHPTHLRRTMLDDAIIWEIVVPWYRDGSSGGDSWGENYYEVDSTIAEMLLAGELVQPLLKKYWGGATEMSDILVITGEAREELFERYRELRAIARSLLVFGKHTDLTGAVGEKGSGRENRGTGRFYVDFETPLGDTCRVYPDEEELVCPHPPQQAEEQAAA